MRSGAAIVAACFALGFSGAARATPQIGAWVAGNCAACHVRPAGWENPDLAQRKCTLSCGGCHVNPTGGGLRHEGGLYYGHEVQPLLPRARKESVAGNATQPAATIPESPMAPLPGVTVADPKSAARYGGIQPSRRFQLGADLRGMIYRADLRDGSEDDVVGKTRIFPMEVDVEAAWRLRNPSEWNRGRLSLVGTVGVVGQRYRGEDFAEEYQHSARVRELFLLVDDLPYQLYVKGGRFLPAFGWKLDDHTSYIRQEQGFDFERWVEGIEVGLNPNYPYAQLSIYHFEPDKFTIPFFDPEDEGYGAALTAGARHFLWQLGGSVMYEARDLNDELWTGVNWSFNVGPARHPWKPSSALPLVYLGELDLRRTTPDGGDSFTGITMMHELSLFLADGLRVTARYDWQDVDRDLDGTERHRYTLGMIANVARFAELIIQYRNNGGAIDSFPFDAPNRRNEALLQLHCWF